MCGLARHGARPALHRSTSLWGRLPFWQNRVRSTGWTTAFRRAIDEVHRRYTAGGTGDHFWVPLVVPDQCLHHRYGMTTVVIVPRAGAGPSRPAGVTSTP